MDEANGRLAFSISVVNSRSGHSWLEKFVVRVPLPRMVLVTIGMLTVTFITVILTHIFYALVLYKTSANHMLPPRIKSCTHSTSARSSAFSHTYVETLPLQRHRFKVFAATAVLFVLAI